MKKLLVMLLAVALLLPFGGARAEGPGLPELPEQAEEGMLQRADGPGFVEDEIIVKFRNDSRPFRVLKVPRGMVMEKVLEYGRIPVVEYAEPNYIAYAFGVPNDPYYEKQWHFGNINMEEAWNIETGDPGVVVAIIDTGVAYETYANFLQAPDLAQTAFAAGYDFVNNDSHPNDDEGHGTHVAGTVAQSTNNNIGVAGIAYSTSLMPVKVLNSSGSGSYDGIASGIRYAADHGAHVINMSLGGAYDSQALEDAVAYAYNKGVTIVAAAGNDNSSAAFYPAGYDAYVISVAATDFNNEKAYYSNYGASIDLAAPGGDATVDKSGDGYVDGILQQTFGRNPKDFGYYFYQGTSMASPHVAGAAALLLAKDGTLTPDEVRGLLQDNAKDLGDDGPDDIYGHGLLDVKAALDAVGGTQPPPGENQAPAADDLPVTTDEDTPATVTLSGSDPDGDAIVGYTITVQPSNGSLSGMAPNLTYTPDLDYNGHDSFTYKVFDGELYSDPATVSITVAPVNDAPVAENQTLSTVVGETLSIQLAAVDVDGDLLSYAVVGEWPAGLTGTPPILEYTTNTAGTVSFYFTATDPSGASDTGTVIIEVSEEPAVVGYTATIDQLTTSERSAGRNTFVSAVATIVVTDSSGNPASGIPVNAQWSGATGDADSGTTGSDGIVVFTSDEVKYKKGTLTFTATVVEVGGTPSGVTESVIYPQ